VVSTLRQRTRSGLFAQAVCIQKLQRRPAVPQEVASKVVFKVTAAQVAQADSVAQVAPVQAVQVESVAQADHAQAVDVPVASGPAVAHVAADAAQRKNFWSAKNN
jgi:hypothetical protein